MPLGKPVVLSSNVSIPGVSVLKGKEYTFENGNTIPVFDVTSIHGLNQLIGNAKFNNRFYGTVLYRGQCYLYKTLIPSLFRNIKQVYKKAGELNRLLHTIEHELDLANEMKVGLGLDSDLKVEGILQHYGVPTHFIDVVDNHWIALWMGLYSREKSKRIVEYYHYKKRELPFGEQSIDSENDELYQYIILLAMPFSDGAKQSEGISINGEFVTVDLRTALPSTFLRPHSQHGLVVRKKGADGNQSSYYDLSSQVVGILRIRIDRADQWLGSGSLLTSENLFPAPGIDYGYDLLLSRSELFGRPEYKSFSIARYY